jgi:hypothetical protein
MVDETRKRRAVRVGAAVAAALLGAGLAGAPAQAAPTQAQHETHGGRFTLPDGAPTPDGAYRITGAYRVVVGVQEYTCTSAGTWSTPTSVPEALLVRYGSPRPMYHYAGPRWKAFDGSITVGAVAERVPKEGTIPWLLLTATPEKSKPGQELHKVTHISRVNTSGGVGPTGACTAGATQRVRYGADYVFWTPTG